MTARVKLKKLKRRLAIERNAYDFLAWQYAAIERRMGDHQDRLSNIGLQLVNARQEINWYQELYDKARKAQIQSAEEAELLRREAAQLRAELARPKSFLRQWIG